MMTGSTTGGVVRGAEGAGGGGSPYNTGDDSLAVWLLHGAATAHHLLREGAQHPMLIAVEQRLSPGQPKPNRPAVGKEIRRYTNAVIYTSQQHLW